MKISDLKQDHPRIYARALECQREQGNKPDDKKGLDIDSFRWADTQEGSKVWTYVLLGDYQHWYDFWDKKQPGIAVSETKGKLSLSVTPYVVMRRMVNQVEQYRNEGEHKAALLTLNALTSFIYDYEKELEERIKQ